MEASEEQELSGALKLGVPDPPFAISGSDIAERSRRQRKARAGIAVGAIAALALLVTFAVVAPRHAGEPTTSVAPISSVAGVPSCPDVVPKWPANEGAGTKGERPNSSELPVLLCRYGGIGEGETNLLDIRKLSVTPEKLLAMLTDLPGTDLGNVACPNDTGALDLILFGQDADAFPVLIQRSGCRHVSFRGDVVASTQALNDELDRLFSQ